MKRGEEGGVGLESLPGLGQEVDREPKVGRRSGWRGPMEVADRRAQVGHLQSATLLFAFSGTGDEWAPTEEFTIGLLIALRNGNNNR